MIRATMENTQQSEILSETRLDASSLKKLGMDFKSTRSEAAFTALYKRIRPGLENYLQRMTKDADLTGHLLSKTMMAVHDKIDQYDPKWHISTWIYRIAYINFCLDLRLSKRKKTTLVSDLAAMRETRIRENVMGEYEPSAVGNVSGDLTDDVPDEDSLQGELVVDKIPDAVRALPQDLRRLVQARYYEGLPFKEIAARYAMDVSTVKKGVNEATRMMRTALRSS